MLFVLVKMKLMYDVTGNRHFALNTCDQKHEFQEAFGDLTVYGKNPSFDKSSQ